MTEAGLALRAVVPEDSGLLFAWANDPLTRKMARNQKPIVWGDHEAWLGRKLASAECRIWIAEVDGKPVGQLRLDRIGRVAEIDYTVAAERRGEGWGTAMLRALTPAHTPGAGSVFGDVRVENEASAAAFRKAGFADAGAAGLPAGYRRFVKELSDR